MRRYFRSTILISLTALVSLSFFGACAPMGSDGKADRDGALNRAEVAVWVQSTSEEVGKYRVLFGLPNRAESVELCKIPTSGIPAGFVCNASAEGYQQLAHLTDKGDRKIFIAEKLAITDKVGFAAFAKQSGNILWNRPRLVYFGKKDVTGDPSSGPVQFSQVKAIMSTSCSGSTCHSSGQGRDAFFNDEQAFAAAKAGLTSRINSTDPRLLMPRGRSFQGSDKQTMLNYLNQIR